MKSEHIVITCLAIISIISVVVTVSDKLRAKKHKRRVPENTLLLLSVLGGSAAMLITMLTIRHKTKKLKFMAGIPAIMILQGLLIYFLLR
ncbi:MAG: DUF1294 domain-containing protein [Clostridia bacterium]|nr:DUF1294 domain-containing protein [Clostridia bacterium]